MGKQLTQEKFREVLSGVLEQAKKQNMYIQERVVRDAFSDYDFSEQQMQMVVEFLRSKKVTVGGAASDLESGENTLAASAVRKKTWSQEEDDYIRRYRGELLAMRAPKAGSSKFRELVSAAASGDENAKKSLLESMLPDIADLACDLYGPGVLLQDLVSEGNLQGMLALERIDFSAENLADDFRRVFLSEVRDGLLTFLGENREVKARDQRMVDRVQEFSDYTEVLKEDLGRKVYLDEVAEFMDIPEEEAEAILRLTGEKPGEDSDEAPDGGKSD
jgi:RNA polymerase primary sigma factor